MQQLKFAVLAFLVILLSACSSSRSTVDAKPAPNTRTAYIQYADEKIDRWDAQANKLGEAGRAKLKTNIADARIELQELQSSTDSSWLSYRNRLESAFDRIETSYNTLARK